MATKTLDCKTFTITPNPTKNFRVGTVISFQTPRACLWGVYTPVSRTPTLLTQTQQGASPYTDFVEYTPTFLGSYTVFAYALDNSPPCIQYYQFDVTAPVGTVIPPCTPLPLSFTPDMPTTGVSINFTLQMPSATSTETATITWIKTEGGLLTQTQSSSPTFSYIPTKPGPHEVEARVQFPSSPYRVCIARRQFTVGGVEITTSTSTLGAPSGTPTAATPTVLSLVQQEQLLFDQFQAFATAFNGTYSSSTTTNLNVQSIQSAITQFVQLRQSAIAGGTSFSNFTSLVDMLYIQYSSIVTNMGILMGTNTSTSTLSMQFTQLNTNFQSYFTIFTQAYNPIKTTTTRDLTVSTSTVTAIPTTSIVGTTTPIPTTILGAATTSTVTAIPTTSTIGTTTPIPTTTLGAATTSIVGTTTVVRGGATRLKRPGHGALLKKSLTDEYRMAPRRQTRRASRKNRKATRKNRKAGRR